MVSAEAARNVVGIIGVCYETLASYILLWLVVLVVFYSVLTENFAENNTARAGVFFFFCLFSDRSAVCVCVCCVLFYFRSEVIVFLRYRVIYILLCYYL